MRISRIALVVVAIISGLDPGSAQSSGAESDRESLRIFLQGALPAQPAFNLSGSPCRWPGVSCSDTDSRVTRIDWQGWELRGSIPQDSIGRLDSLLYLNLYNNSISGTLPPDLWDLPQLQYLNLSRNLLQGSMSIALGRPSGLFFLDLSQNHLAGQIPPSIGLLKSLVMLNLSRNDFQDLVPGAIFGCSFLRTLDLSYNRISGVFPSGLSHLVQLQALYLNNNMLSGMVPPETSRLHYLAVLDLSENHFTGPFPRVDGLRKLEVLNISGNFLGGTIPTGTFRIPGLRKFSARSNFFVGSLPTPSLMHSTLSYIDLGQNNLSGNVSVGIWSMNSVETLRLDGNSLSGLLPSQVGAALKELDLKNNEFSGPVSSDLGAFQSLAYLDLSTNRLSGPLPEKLTGFPSLVHLGLDNNPFVESRFPKLQELKKLEYLNLSATQLTGGIPEEIGNLQTLKQLDLSHNELNGTLPESLGSLVGLTSLDMSYNQLNGSIPNSMARLTQLQHLNFSYNDLSGDVPGWPFMLPSGLLGNKGLCGRVLNVPCPREIVPSSGHSPSDNSEHNIRDSPHRRHLRVAVIVGIVTGSAAAILCVVAGLCYCRGSVKVFNKKQEPTKEERFISMSGPFSSEMDPSVWAAGVRDPHTIPVVMFEKPLLNLTFSDLVQATANFSKDAQVPDGGCGPVFQGVLPGGIHVAVKILGEGIPSEDVASACAQLAAIGRLKHPNVVPLLGYCMVGVERLLVYDYVQDGGDLYGRLHELPEGMPNTEDWSTDTWEHGQEGTTNAAVLAVLPWSVRHRVALCTARALAFLHHGCSPPVVHGDVKASNVLLDAECEARLAGTGLAQLVEIGTGEAGYVPPEFGSSSSNAGNNNSNSNSGSSREMSPKADVYSFGVVLLELVTGKRPVGDDYPGGHGNQGGVVQWTRWLVKEKRGFKALDVRVMQGDEDMTEMLEALRVAYLCTAETPSKRPTMQQVVGLLKDLRPSTSISGELVGGSF
ncbi:probable LRR receptor-like serine/threonine-protein kinase At2g24230 [Selaginella moellendorffii]|uniref:probable LRR receptor-like serine/threonine-protein kinase At2g24230 n=1 Tax=Selaginella moellendorffii TaxID=88036 RepID=UPI000D1CDDE8|nr:probable LRR receptor-like serine/threonine-protein kinase At2g24230 [Selaginella moellendorffii]|eukprot:XP_024518353.1 probable LRR receptor-like serine/threonine-protein kinase At2g24230 [Selaginella moellendorffii]